MDVICWLKILIFPFSFWPRSGVWFFWVAEGIGMIESVCCRKDVKTNSYEWEFISRLHSLWHVSTTTNKKKKRREGGVQRENCLQWQAGRRRCSWHPETNNFLRHSIQGNRQFQHFSYSICIVLFRTHSNSLLIVPISSASLEQGEVLCGWLVGELCAGVFLSPLV